MIECIGVHASCDTLLSGRGIGAAYFGAGLIGCEHPFDASGGGIALSFPGSNFGFDLCLCGDPPVQALAAQDSDLDFNHVEPAGVLGDIVELQSAQNPARFVWREGPLEHAGRLRRQIVEHDADELRLGEVNVREIAHTDGKVDASSAVGDFDLAPRAVHVEEDE